jgi:hypothetical protein
MMQLMRAALVLFALCVPAAAQQVGIAWRVSPSAEACRVFAGVSARLFSYQVSTGASAGYIMVFDATAAPADGAVTPALPSVQIAASSTYNFSPTNPALFANGVTICFSTTGPFSKTASATAMLGAQVQ